jgi:hypothetical protein
MHTLNEREESLREEKRFKNTYTYKNIYIRNIICLRLHIHHQHT